MLRGFGALAPVFAPLVLALPIFGANVTSAPLPPLTNAYAIQLDASGNIYIAGSFAASSDANVPNHAFVAKLSPDASQTIWRSTLAGSGSDTASSLALGPGNAVFVTGYTMSKDFPTTQGAMQTTPSGSQSGFAARLDSNGKIVYSTYLPGSAGAGIAVDSTGDAFITGQLASTDVFVPTPGAVTGATTAFQFGNSQSYILELDPGGARPLLAIEGLGGSRIVLDSQGNIYAAGSYYGPAAPTTPGALQPSAATQFCSNGIAFVFPCENLHIAKIDPSGRSLRYATYLSGMWGSATSGITVDGDGNLTIAGSTSSPDFPSTPGGYQPEFFPRPTGQAAAFNFSAPPSQGFVARLNAAGTGLLWSTFLGGSGGSAGSFTAGDNVLGMTVDAAGDVFVIGAAYSPDFPGLWNVPVASRPKSGSGIATTPFLARLSSDGSTLSPLQLLPFYAAGVALRVDGAAVAVGSAIAIAGMAPLGRVVTICDAADNAKLVRVAPGQLLTLYGTNLAPQGAAPPAAQFPTTLNGVTVAFNGIAAPILYTSPIQVNVQVPYEIAAQTQVTMQVSSQSVTPPVSETYFLGITAVQLSVFVAPAAFRAAIFDQFICGSQNLSGLQPVALNADGTVNSCANPAPAGSLVTLFLNGVGATSPAQTTGALATSADAVSSVSAGNATANPPSSSSPARTIPGWISGLVEIQVTAPAASSVLYMTLSSGPPLNPLYVRGPGVIIWTAANNTNQ